MEIAIALFIGVWLSAAASWGYVQMKKDSAKESEENGR